MSERAAVLRAIGEPLCIEDIDLKCLAADQVRVRLRASGVCHSDLSLATGALPFMPRSVLGHEGAGIVEEVGAEVHHVVTGDHVVIAWTAACGHCWFCVHGDVHLCERAIVDVYAMPYATDAAGDDLFAAMGVSSFATATNCLGRAVVKIDRDIPFEIAALIGCGVSTGAGAALNTTPVAPGSAVAVIGLGGVGLSAMLGAIVCGASRVIAVDPLAARRDAALRLGATHTVDPADGRIARQVRALTGGRGADTVFEAVGRATSIEDAVAATRKGGATCVVGAAPTGDMVALSAYDLFMNGKKLVGCQYGSVVPHRDFPLLLDLWKAGRLPLEQLITRRLELDEINSALDDLRLGKGLRAVVVHG